MKKQKETMKNLKNIKKLLRRNIYDILRGTRQIAGI